MLTLLIFILFVCFIIVLLEWRERKRKLNANANTDANVHKQAPSRPDGCCGEHLVCEKEEILNSSNEVVYYDDEELDALSNIDPTDYTTEQYNQIRDVFQTLKEEDVRGWCRSMQQRSISLPDDIREEALLIVREQRSK